MRSRLVTVARRAITVTWLLLVIGLLGVAACTHLATTFAIRGGSMEPAIPFGSLIVDEPVSDDALRVGDVVTARADNGVVVSHRISRIAEVGGERYLEMKGDANPTPDPVLVPTRAVIGRVALSLPYLGFLAVMLGTPSGLLSLLAMLGAGLLLILLAEQLEDELSDGDRTAGAAEAKGPPRGALA